MADQKTVKCHIGPDRSLKRSGIDFRETAGKDNAQVMALDKRFPLCRLQFGSSSKCDFPQDTAQLKRTYINNCERYCEIDCLQPTARKKDTGTDSLDSLLKTQISE
jgi:hypothetical protein